ncbi:hypothetical protein B0T17DRAFT_538618 [Bombardia bombarda]|uniref:Uncharacterized protein n=1 Tax=Bombardia bombarda TaxID=252184 RepID=A0AA39WHR5_9PEZI|nr:hypothetical protein B0T17DRAFT_538618 [Bombardia bombarda]
MMKPHTMNWSLRLSRWKQLVTTSFSSAPLQMGRLYCRQKARLHCVQLEEAARGVSERLLVWRLSERERASGRRLCCGSVPPRAEEVVVVEEEGASEAVEWEGGGGGGGGGLSCCGPRGMMVLLVKQVHLQKVGAEAAATSDASDARSTIKRWCIRVIVALGWGGSG